MKKYLKTTIVLFVTMLLGACAEGTDSLDISGDSATAGTDSPDNSGGSAGEDLTAPDSIAVALVSPLVGIYQLPINWAGLPGSEAYLEIREPNSEGEAIALLYRLSISSNCVNSSSSPAEVIKDPFGQRVFMNDLFEMPNSVLSRPLNNLIINLPRDVQDVDGDGDENEAAQLEATPIGDLPEICQ